MKRSLVIAALVLPLFILGGAWLAGTRLSAPAPATVGNCPLDLACESIEFTSESGSKLKGWFINGEAGRGTIVLMHGLRSNRSALVDRMRFLRKSGYAVLAFDFQGSGESPGDKLTFGWLERLDAEAAVRYAMAKRPGAKIGVVGISMGGAAFLLSTNMPPVQAVVLELVYPRMRDAVNNRMDQWLFSGARYVSPLLTMQFPFRVGVSADSIKPIDHVRNLHVPVLVIAGETDPFTRLEESKQLFDAANEPKELWIVNGASHQDLWKFSPRDYQDRVLGFFEPIINDRPAPGGDDEKNQSCNCADDDARRADDERRRSNKDPENNGNNK